MLLPVTIRAYQDTFVYFPLNPFPATGESILGNPEFLPAIGVMEFKRILTSLVATNGTLTAFVFDSFLTNGFTPFRNSTLQVLSTISVCSFVWHTFYSIPQMFPQSPALPLSYAGIFYCQAFAKAKQVNYSKGGDLGKATTLSQKSSPSVIRSESRGLKSDKQQRHSLGIAHRTGQFCENPESRCRIIRCNDCIDIPVPNGDVATSNHPLFHELKREPYRLAVDDHICLAITYVSDLNHPDETHCFALREKKKNRFHKTRLDAMLAGNMKEYKSVKTMLLENNRHIDGVSRCARYAFGPNRLHYCGPTATGAADELRVRASEGESLGTVTLLRRFETLYPYLVHIAEGNGIRDPFDDRVVEAYWIGNDLLTRIEQKHLYRHLKDSLSIKKKVGAERFESSIANKIRHGGIPHHSFHVLNIWKGSGEQTLEQVGSVAECLVSAGTVSEIDGPWVTLETEQLTYDGKRLGLSPETRRLPRPLDASDDWDSLAPGDLVSFHWGVLCESLTPVQFERLRKYTHQSITLANRDFGYR